MARRTALVLALLAGLVAGPAGATTLVVATTDDLVNGDTSSPDALIANPGPDGISLREAIMAIDNVAGPHTITFAPVLAGQAIVLTQQLPLITQDHITLTGLTTADGQPNITIDASRVTVARGTLFVTASYFTLTGLRFTGTVSRDYAVTILAGALLWPGMAPQQVSNIRIEGNVFSNEGIDQQAGGIQLGTDPSGMGATVRNVTIARNTFVHYVGDADGIKLQAGGSNCLIQDVVIFGNTFSQATFPVELVSFNGSGSRIVGTRIFRNTFTNSHQPVSIVIMGQDGSPTTSGNLIDDTIIAGNVFSGNENPAIALQGGFINAAKNTVRNTQIVNNLMSASRRNNGINIVGGSGGGTGNRVEGVRITNNTIVRGPESGLAILNNHGGGTGNVVTDVIVRNTIFSGSGDDFFGEVTRDRVSFSITSMPGFAGVNGNRAADPLFVNPAQGDYHLQPGSPAINAGTSDGAPVTDLDCRQRVGLPDIGAFEFGTLPGLCLDLILNGANYHPGDPLRVATLVDNLGLPVVVDFYFGALLPDGDTVVFFTRLAFTSGVGSLAKPATTLRPIVAGVDLATPFTLSQPAFFTYTWTGGEPPGTYTLFVAAVKPGALADNSLDAGDIVALRTAAVTFAP